MPFLLLQLFTLVICCALSKGEKAADDHMSRLLDRK